MRVWLTVEEATGVAMNRAALVTSVQLLVDGQFDPTAGEKRCLPVFYILVIIPVQKTEEVAV